MRYCECGCKAELTGKQKRWSPGCGNRFWSNARKLGAGKVRELLTRAVSPETTPVSILIKADRRKTFHFAPLENNPRLEKILARLKRGSATTVELTNDTGTTRASSDVSELRANGHVITCTYLKKAESGRKIFMYEWMGKESGAVYVP
jgi:hypothetical protein